QTSYESWPNDFYSLFFRNSWPLLSMKKLFSLKPALSEATLIRSLRLCLDGEPISDDLDLFHNLEDLFLECKNLKKLNKNLPKLINLKSLHLKMHELKSSEDLTYFFSLP